MNRLSRVPRARRSTIVLMFAVAALAFPLGVWANHQFADVPTGASYHDDVEALVAKGITSGCGGGNYCPSNPVTRGQMAQFLNRMGDLDGSFAPSVNADETDDWDVGCPAGTVWAGGLCLETTTRTAASIYDAGETCQQLGGSILLGRGQQWTLPNSLTLRGANNAGEITLADGGEWSSDIWVDDANSFQGMTANNFLDATLLLPDAAGDAHAFRCGAVPLSFDPITIISPFGSPENDLPAAPESEFVPVPLNEDGSPAD